MRITAYKLISSIIYSLLKDPPPRAHGFFCQLIFTNCIVDTLDSGNEGLSVRLQLLLEKSTEAVYRAVSRGLFERHKLLFAFMLCTGILRAEGEVRSKMAHMTTVWHFVNYDLRQPASCPEP